MPRAVVRAALVAVLGAAVVLGAASPSWATAAVFAAASVNSGGLTAGSHYSTSAPADPTPGANTMSNGNSAAAQPYVVVPVPQGNTAGAYVFPTSPAPSTYLPQPSRFASAPAFYQAQFLCPAGPNPACPLPTGPSAPNPGSGASGPSPLVLAIEAVDHASFPPATIETWPPQNYGQGGSAGVIVNFPTMVHMTNWAPLTASATAGAVTSTVTATPSSMTITSQDSTDGGTSYEPISTSCTGPGAIYNPNEPMSAQDACSLRWRWPSATYQGSVYPLKVTVNYSVRWTAIGAPGGGVLPSVTHTTTFGFRVGEIEILGGPTR
jgi:hypothetical protein